jgi:hypothetical protein
MGSLVHIGLGSLSLVAHVLPYPPPPCKQLCTRSCSNKHTPTQASKEGTETAKSGSFKDEQDWGKKCFEDLDQRRMGRPATRTWSTDFLLREGSNREEIGKWLKNKSIPWQLRRRLLQVVTGTFPSGQQMVKYGYKEKAECTLCKKAHEESGSSWNREVPKETIGHIQSVGCLGQKEVVTAVHNACIRELLKEIDVHGKADRHMKLLTVETESRLGTLWDEECKNNKRTIIISVRNSARRTNCGTQRKRRK